MNPVALSLALTCILTTAHAQTTIGGQITTQTWTAANSPYIIEADTFVVGNATLTIEPGVEVRFNPATNLVIGTASFGTATLEILGTADNPILFTSNAPYLPDPRPAAPGDWGNIHLTAFAQDATFDTDGNPIAGSRVQHAIMEYARALEPGTGVIRVTNTTTAIQDCTIRQFAGRAIYFTGGQNDPTHRILIERTTIERPPNTPPDGTDGIRVVGGVGSIIRDCTFRDLPIAIALFDGEQNLLSDLTFERCGLFRLFGIQLRRMESTVIHRPNFIDSPEGRALIQVRQSQATTITNFASSGNRRPDGSSPLAIDITETGPTTITDSVFRGFSRAINADSSTGITLERCDFIDNHNTTAPGAAMNASAVNQLTLRECRFINNKALDYAGAVSLTNDTGPTTITDSVFRGFSRAINADSSTGITLERCDFIDNHNTTAPGAAMNASAVNQLNLLECRFINNKALDYAGAVSLTNDTGPVRFEACEFTGNTAVPMDPPQTFTQGGGAIHINACEPVTIIDSTFRANRANQGGAILVEQGDIERIVLRINGSHFLQNFAAFQGGAIAIRGSRSDIDLSPSGTGDPNAFAANKAGAVGNNIANFLPAQSFFGNDIDATEVCWNTTDPAQIAASIYDGQDDPTRSIVDTSNPAPCPPEPLPCSLADTAPPFAQLTFADIAMFLNAYTTEGPTADLAQPLATLTFADISSFLTAFAAGCPNQ